MTDGKRSKKQDFFRVKKVVDDFLNRLLQNPSKLDRVVYPAGGCASTIAVGKRLLVKSF